MPEPAITPATRLWCLSRGSKIQSCRGDTLVEDLVSGLTIRTTSGDPVLIQGITRIQSTYQSDAGSRATWPIRICANAIATGIPGVDVVLLPDQEITGALLGTGGQGAPVRTCDLVNGATILREEVDVADWVCIAIETPGPVVVSGLELPGEVPEGITQPWRYIADRSQKQPRCRFDLPSRAAHATLRRRLVEQARLLGHTSVTDPDLRVIAGNQEISPEVDGAWCRFVLPYPATEVVLASRSCVPAEISASTDSRRLGVSISKIRAGSQDIPVDDPNLQIGWHYTEKNWRWTAGTARLALPAPTEILEVEIAGTVSSGYPIGQPAYNGHVDACTVSRISGWALWDWKPASLDIFVNNERIGRVLCNKPRAGLKQSGHPFNAGFEFAFPRPIVLSDTVSAHFSDGTHLQGSPIHPALIEMSSPVLRQRPARQIFVVLGMHRSGTSLCSSALSSLGVDMSEDIEVRSTNEQGHWERNEVVQFHDRILQIFDRDWYDPRHALSLPSRWWTEAPVRSIRDEMIAWLAEQLRHIRFFGFKDPRTARMLPLWDEIFAALDIDPRYIYCVRDPHQVAASLLARDGIEVRDTEYRWMVYNSHAVLGIGARSTCIIPYDDWFSEDGKNVARLASCVGIAWPPKSSSLESLFASIVNPQLRHHEGNPQGGTGYLSSDTLYRHILASVPRGHFNQDALDTTAAFVSFEEFIQPILASASAYRGPSTGATSASLIEGRDTIDYSPTQLRLAGGLVTTIHLYAKALRDAFNEVTTQMGSGASSQAQVHDQPEGGVGKDVEQ